MRSTKSFLSVPDADQLHIKHLSDLREIKALKKDWQDLETRCGNNLAAFQTFDWCYQWCVHFLTTSSRSQTSADRHAMIICLYKGTQLTALWPLQIENKAGIKTLSWLSSPALQYGMALYDPNSNVERGFSEVWAYLRSYDGVDLLRLEDIPAKDPLHGFLLRHCRPFAKSASSVLNLAAIGDWENYQASLKKTARRARRKRFNKFSRQGDVAFTVHRNRQIFAHLAQIAIGWKREWLNARNWPTRLMGQDAFKAFVACLADDSQLDEVMVGENCEWVAGELSLDDKPVAIEIGAVFKGRYFSFLGAFDATFEAFSPGKIEIELMIKWALDNNICFFDFLSVPSQYKADWTDSSVEIEGFTYALNLRGKLFQSLWVKRLRPAAKAAFLKVPVRQRKLVTNSLGLLLKKNHVLENGKK